MSHPLPIVAKRGPNGTQNPRLLTTAEGQTTTNNSFNLFCEVPFIHSNGSKWLAGVPRGCSPLTCRRSVPHMIPHATAKSLMYIMYHRILETMGYIGDIWPGTLGCVRYRVACIVSIRYCVSFMGTFIRLKRKGETGLGPRLGSSHKPFYTSDQVVESYQYRKGYQVSK